MSSTSPGSSVAIFHVRSLGVRFVVAAQSWRVINVASRDTIDWIMIRRGAGVLRRRKGEELQSPLEQDSHGLLLYCLPGLELLRLSYSLALLWRWPGPGSGPV